MVRGTQLLDILEAVLGGAGGIAVIHSSLAALAPEQPIGKWQILAALRTLVRRGWTLAFPAFTFSFCRSGQFERDTGASETGILADWVHEGLVGAIRTDHPIYSFVAIGPRSHEIADCPSETTFGDTSPFGLFERENARVVMLGTGWEYCTSFHRYEELAEVEYRFVKSFSGEITRNGRVSPTLANMWVRDLDIGARNAWGSLVDEMRTRGAIVSIPLWRGQVEAVSMQDIRSSATELLEVDQLAFVENAAEVRFRLHLAAEAKRQPPYRIAILGHSNLELMCTTFQVQLAALLPGRQVTIYSAPFGQIAQQIMMPSSMLSSFDPELTIFADRLEDLLAMPTLSLIDSDRALVAVDDYVGLIRQHVKANGGTMIVHRFAVAEWANVDKGGELVSLISACNARLEAGLNGAERIYWIDLAAEAAVYGPVSDARLWHIGRIPYAQAFAEKLARRWSGMVLSLLGKTARLLVLDLDNTIWGGVLGEDGPEAIAVGGDFPGNAFLQFQHELKALSDKGMALAIVSKNDEDLALDVLSNHKGMVIRPDNLVGHRINWQPKWQSILEIATELDLGLESVMFIDDNPVERESVRSNLPQIKVLDLPQDVTGYVAALLESPFLEVLQTGKEDKKRVASYKARQMINTKRSAAASIDEFLVGLGMKLSIQPLDASNLARAAQLCQKTNQFNTTTRRLTARDLEAMRDAGADVAVLALGDKYIEHENIGLILLKPESDGGVVDLFLLSCRVLGRTVEQAVLAWAINRARARGWPMLVGEIVETPRNTPVRTVFANNGFTETGSGLWRINTDSPRELPRWFEFYDGFA